MTNVELKNKVEEIVAIEDYFDRAIAISNFDKEYRGSDFFKVTKKPLKEVIEEYIKMKITEPAGIKKAIQKIIDGLNFDNAKSVIDELGKTFGQENEELLSSLSELKDLIK